jgi:hypothetical protein
MGIKKLGMGEIIVGKLGVIYLIKYQRIESAQPPKSQAN